MLIQKPLKSQDIVTIKLSNGEELIARYESETDTHFTVSKASVVAANQNGMGLIPWIMSAEPGTVILNKNNIVAYTPTTKDIADKFTELTTTIKMI
jgi:hypothetical protein